MVKHNYNRPPKTGNKEFDDAMVELWEKIFGTDTEKGQLNGDNIVGGTDVEVLTLADAGVSYTSEEQNKINKLQEKLTELINSLKSAGYIGD